MTRLVTRAGKIGDIPVLLTELRDEMIAFGRDGSIERGEMCGVTMVTAAGRNRRERRANASKLRRQRVAVPNSEEG